MSKLTRLKRYLSKIDAPCLWFSGGKDSSLLLYIMLEMGKTFSILRFDEGQTREQKQAVDAVILKHNLRVYAYDPQWATMVSNDDGELALISGYAVGKQGETMSLVRDIVDGDRCSFDIPMPVAKGSYTPIYFADHILGTKSGESHWTMAGKPMLTAPQWETGAAIFHAPLYKFTDAEVVRELVRFGIEWKTPDEASDLGHIPACSNCLHGIGDVMCPKTGNAMGAVNWSGADNLRNWQAANGAI